MGAVSEDIVTRCLRRHSQNIATITGLFLAIALAFGALVAVVPAKAGEEGARIGMGVFAGFWLVAAIVHRVVTKRKRDRMALLLGAARNELARAAFIEVRRGNARGYAVDLVDRNGVTLRLGAPDAAAARELATKLVGS